MSALAKLQWGGVLKQYNNRLTIHHQLMSFHRNKQYASFVELLLGISDPGGNYSAAEHKLGPRILSGNVDALSRIVTLAEEFMKIKIVKTVPKLISEANLSYLKV